MPTTTTSPAVLDGARQLPIAAIRPSAANPRTEFDPSALAELAASIKAHGVIEPLVVRPVPRGADGSTYELVAGERRLRAAAQAKLAEVPVIVRELSDSEALELALIENLQREDLHPLDEAEAFARLQRERGHTLQDIALKVGKSVTHVASRLRFRNLPANARAAFRAGKFGPAVALLIARIPNENLASEATDALLKTATPGEVLLVGETRDWIRDRYMLDLAVAPFPTADPSLVSGTGPCGACPKRTGNQRDLFGDIKGKDVCTDPACFAGKREAHWARARQAAEAAGGRVLPDKQGKGLFFNGGELLPGTTFVNLDKSCDLGEKKRTWRRLTRRHPTPQDRLGCPKRRDRGDPRLLER